jgi:hypothetical protein
MSSTGEGSTVQRRLRGDVNDHRIGNVILARSLSLVKPGPDGHVQHDWAGYPPTRPVRPITVPRQPPRRPPRLRYFASRNVTSAATRHASAHAPASARCSSAYRRACLGESWPGRQPLCQREVMPRQRIGSDGIGDVRADRVMVQPVLGRVAGASGLNQPFARAAYECLARRGACPASHPGQLVEREWLARGAQDAQPVHQR